MKKDIFKIITLILLTLSFSCEDATELIQEGELTEDQAFRTLADIQTGLLGVYAAYDPDAGGNGTGNSLYANAILTDNVKSGLASNGQGAQDYDYLVSFTTGSIPDNIWNDRYVTINFANRVLRAMGNLTFTGDELVEANHIKAQLLAIRALCHFEVLQYFATDYQDPNALGAININYVPEIDEEFQRNTVAENLAFIKSDLDAANSLFDTNNPTVSNPIWINQDFVKVLRLRIALTEGDYSTNHITLANELLASYPLANFGQYVGMFLDVDNTEVIFKLERTVGDGSVVRLFYFNFVGPGDGFLEMSNELYNLLSENPGDARLLAYVNNQSTIVGVNDSSNEILINKYPGSADGVQLNDIKLMRASEVQLIKAELQARNNMLTDAASSVQVLRDARGAGSTPTYNTLNEALTDIMKERRKELCFEGHRWLDIKRIGNELGTGVSRLSVDCSSFEAVCDVSSNDFRFTMAIPQDELNGNSIISQNPGY
ncbi:RagB/SusD family nutrient uptake outer membrane protein [Ichthyenterobacterium magnum]|uniref:Putative outer membrane starch-binding protein n=1 Tax=Ichthyenterobacterium magnum TaxID=1230530 RepID=A0A420DFT1_9FLAO|nr:RagB/SusD family nutrient uptake outer membrane protein [Ichthyenterobacterium magnum]RKE92023.1 putative outer membrane starch-binding protein [Ichthyenterobacterium magnum]